MTVRWALTIRPPTHSDGQGMFLHRDELADVVDADVDDAALGRKIREVLALSSSL